MSFSYARGEISSFVRARHRPYIACMENRYPTYQELQRVEFEARRLRAEEMARLFRIAGETVRNFFKLRGMRHA
jgi:hypothetical protein